MDHAMAEQQLIKMLNATLKGCQKVGNPFVTFKYAEVVVQKLERISLVVFEVAFPRHMFKVKTEKLQTPKY